MARLIGRIGCLALILVLLVAGYLFGREHIRRHPQDVPWTELRLNDPIGAFTGRKIAALGDGFESCRSLLRRAGSVDALAPPRAAGEQCGYADGIRLTRGGSRPLHYQPSAPVASCPVAAGLLVLERQVIDLAALRHFGTRAVGIEHFGTYSCRRLYGRNEGPFSEHATADAIDISGFRLADGRRISVLRDWSGNGPEAAFLREVRDGACRLFSTVLSPDYNAAHRDHLHLDQAERGAAGWRMCR